MGHFNKINYAAIHDLKCFFYVVIVDVKKWFKVLIYDIEGYEPSLGIIWIGGY